MTSSQNNQGNPAITSIGLAKNFVRPIQLVNRAPKSTDKVYPIGQTWIDQSVLKIYQLAGFTSGVPQWRYSPMPAGTGENGQILQSTGASTPPAWTQSTYPSTNSQGDLIYGSAANALSTLAKSTSATRYLANTGTNNAPKWDQVSLTTGVTGVLPIANGGTNLSTAATNGQLLIGNGTGYTLATLSEGAGIDITNGAGSINITFDSTEVPTIPTSFSTNSGTATPSANSLTISGGNGLTTSGSGSTVTVAMTAPVSIANGGSNSTGASYTTAGVFYYNGTAYATTSAGTSGQVLTSNGAGVAPTYQAIPVTGLPTNYYVSANPAYATTTTYTVASFNVRNSANDGDLSKTTSTTLDIATTGLNGIAQSAALTGAVAVTNASTTVTGTSTTFTTDFQVGDVIYIDDTAQGRRITVITNNTSLTVESAFTITDASSTYRRGGRAPTTHYYCYAIGIGTSGTTPGILLSTRNVAGGETLVDLPTSYTRSRQMKYVLTTDTTNVLLRTLWDGGCAHYVNNGQIAPYAVVNGGNPTTLTSVSTATIVPKTARRIHGIATGASTSGNATFYTADGDSTQEQQRSLAVANNATANMFFTVGTDSSQNFKYRTNNANLTLTLEIYEYFVTEVI